MREFGGTSSILCVNLLSAMRDGISPHKRLCTSSAMSHKMSAGIPSNLRPASDEINFCLRALPVWLPNMHNILPDVEVGVLQVTCKVGVLENTQSAFRCSVSHMAILSVPGCKVDVRRLSAQAFVTSFQRLPLRANTFLHVRTICEQTVDNSPTDSNPSSFHW